MLTSLFSYHKKLFYLLLFLLPVQLNYYFWPEWAYVLGRRVDYLSPILYATDLLVIIMLAFWILERKINVVFFKNEAIIKTIVLITLLVSTNIFFSSVPVNSAFKWMMVIKLGFLIGYIIKNNFSILQIILPLLLSSFWVSAIGILQVLNQQSIGFYWLGERSFNTETLHIAKFFFCYPFELSSACWQTIRAYGTFSHPNILGGFLSLVLLITIKHKKLLFSYIKTLRLYSYVPFEAMIFLGILSVPLLALLLTFSRSSWISFIVGLVFISSLSSIKKLIVGVGIAGMIIISTLPIPFILVSNTESFLVRRLLNEAAFTMIADNWLAGVGLGNFLTALPNYLVSRTIYFLQPVHNIYVLFLSEFGLIGLLISILIIKQMSFIVKKLLTDNLYLVVPIILIGLSDHYFLTLHQGQLILAVILSTLYITSKHR